MKYLLECVSDALRRSPLLVIGLAFAVLGAAIQCLHPLIVVDGAISPGRVTRLLILAAPLLFVAVRSHRRLDDALHKGMKATFQLQALRDELNGGPQRPVDATGGQPRHLRNRKDRPHASPLRFARPRKGPLRGLRSAAPLR